MVILTRVLNVHSIARLGSVDEGEIGRCLKEAGKKFKVICINKEVRQIKGGDKILEVILEQMKAGVIGKLGRKKTELVPALDQNQIVFMSNNSGARPSPLVSDSRNNRFDQLGIPQEDQDALRNSSRVVWGAVILNGVNFLAKTTAWLYTGSHSMFAESVHSLADTANQLILAVGIRKSLQRPTADHPYGYHPMRYIAPLISGVGIFCVGCGLSMYHGIEALTSSSPELFISPLWAYGILTFSLLSESTTLFMAVKVLRDGARRSKLQFRDYVAKNSDPGVIVVLLEDVAAVMGIGIAAASMALSTYYGTHLFDAWGSLMIGSLLGAVATFIIQKNTIALVGKSIPRDTLNSINRVIEKDILIRAIHDVKATDLGNGVVRYKAEVDVDGRELSKKYLERVDLKDLLEEIRAIKDEKDVETFILVHGEGVVDLLGAEVDRIEKELRRNHPKVRHVDLEVL